jgi:hypothetical protein
MLVDDGDARARGGGILSTQLRRAPWAPRALPPGRRSAASRAAWLLTVVALAGCGDDDPARCPVRPDAGVQALTLLYTEVMFDRAQLEFGDVPMGTTSTATAFLENRGGLTAELSHPFTTAGFDILEISSMRIPPDGTAAVTLTMTPTAAGGLEGLHQIDVLGAGCWDETLTLRLFGRGI